jgi:hypothetical protein
MKVILFIRDNDDQWVAISTATNQEALDDMMRYASYKVFYGHDVKIVHA